MIFTDGKGVPFVKPRREDFESCTDYFVAFCKYKDDIAKCANGAFDAAFRSELQRT